MTTRQFDSSVNGLLVGRKYGAKVAGIAIFFKELFVATYVPNTIGPDPFDLLRVWLVVISLIPYLDRIFNADDVILKHTLVSYSNSHTIQGLSYRWFLSLSG